MGIIRYLEHNLYFPLECTKYKKIQSSKEDKMKITKFFFLLLFINISLHAEVFSIGEYNLQFDLPEGSRLTDTDRVTEFLFENPDFPIDFLILIQQQDKNIEKQLQGIEKKLNCTSEHAKVTWRNRNCVISRLQFSYENQYDCIGWAVAIPLPDKKVNMFAVSYTPIEYVNQIDSFIISSLDSISIDKGSITSAGIMTSWAYPLKSEFEQELNIGKRKIPVILNEIDAEANQYVADREYDIYSYYATTKYRKKAMQRFYRMIYKDAYSRLKKAAFVIKNDYLYKSENPECDSAIAEEMLKWVQGFQYERDLQGSDFTSLPAVLMGKGNDCDSRSLLLAVLFNQMGIKSVIFVSGEYSHAMVGAEISGKGARIKGACGNYRVGETTADVDFGLVNKSVSDLSKWFEVDFRR